MRKFFVALGLSLILGQPLSAENAVYNTSVSAVELHPDGVRITRGFDINLPAGTHRLAFRDFRIDGNIGSLQVDFGSAKVRISGFQITTGALSPFPPLKPPHGRPHVKHGLPHAASGRKSTSDMTPWPHAWKGPNCASSG